MALKFAAKMNISQPLKSKNGQHLNILLAINLVFPIYSACFAAQLIFAPHILNFMVYDQISIIDYIKLHLIIQVIYD